MFSHFYWKSHIPPHSLLGYMEVIFLKIHVSHSMLIHYQWPKSGCDRSIIKGTLPEEQCTFLATSQVPLREYSWKFVCGTLRKYPTNQVWLWLIKNNGTLLEEQFGCNQSIITGTSPEAMYLLCSILASNEGMFWKLVIWHCICMMHASPQMSYASWMYCLLCIS